MSRAPHGARMAEQPIWFDWLEPVTPDWFLTREFVLVPAHWFGLLLAIVLSVIAHKVVHSLLHRRVKHWSDAVPTIDDEYADRVTRPFSLAVAGLVAWGLLLLLELPDTGQSILEVAVKFVVIWGLFWGFYRLVDLVHLLFSWDSGGELTPTEAMFVPMLEKTLRLFVMVTGAILAADTFSVDVATLLAGLGIGGLAVALAARDTLSNLFGSITILFDKPFQIGDWILVGDVEGVVEDIGLRTTRIRTFRDTQIVVPNSQLVNTSVENYGKRDWQRYSTHLHLDPVTSAEQVEAFVQGMYALIDAHPRTRKDYRVVRLHNVAPSSHEILLYVFWKVETWSQELEERERLLLDAMKLADTLRIQFADGRARFMGGEQHWPRRPEREPDVDDDAYEAATHPLPAGLEGEGRQDLIEMCQDRGLPTDGTKAELIARLEAHSEPTHMTKWVFHALERVKELAAEHGGPHADVHPTRSRTDEKGHDDENETVDGGE